MGHADPRVIEGGSRCGRQSQLQQATPCSLPKSLFVCHSLYFTTMSFTGKYELESQENYEEFLETIGKQILYLKYMS